ncbi:hypothetical protein [Halalkalicoccus salilacus]|uniref:hypothetical protein n=1 Tax=Halalkalicoccus salilacus TaxID=3117459 RepID=UPI00300ED40C
MAQDNSEWFSAQELAYIRDPNSIDSKHRSTVRNRIEEKVNEGVIYDVERIPELVDFLDSSTKESIQLRSEPTYIGRGLGQLYPEQLTELVFGLVLSERKSNEPVEEFAKRFDAIWEEIEADIHRRIQNTQQLFEIQLLFRTFTKDLFYKINQDVSLPHELMDVEMRIPVDEFVKWTVAQKGEEDFTYLPDILDAAFGITTDDSRPRRFADYWNLLTQAAADGDIHPPDGAEWAIDYKNPSPRNHEMHEAALSALDNELETAARRFRKEAQILERDQLLALGLYTHSKLELRDKQILDRIPCSNRRDGWSRYDTRRANILTDDHDLPLLSREITSKRGADEKHYEFTDYGRFVHWFTLYVEEKASYSAVLRDFLRDVPEDLVDEANDWITEYIGTARRLDWEADGTLDSTDNEDAGKFSPSLSNSSLWIRVIKATDDAEWEED